MDCPQCGAEIPSDDSFCGKCGYARRDDGPQRLDQSRIRVHEEPEARSRDSSAQTPAQKRERKHTVMGMPSATPPAGVPSATPPQESAEPPPPAKIASARGRKRAPQKTMLGVPRPDFPELASTSDHEEAQSSEPREEVATEHFAPPRDSASVSQRARARVRYDSADEPFPMLQRRKTALRTLAVLVLCAGGWLAYRYLTLHG